MEVEVVETPEVEIMITVVVEVELLLLAHPTSDKELPPVLKVVKCPSPVTHLQWRLPPPWEMLLNPNP